jgi:hypothetical protein
VHGPRRLTIALSGATGSGKSTLAAALVDSMGGGRASFGRYTALLAGMAYLNADRRALQDAGELAVRADPAGFVAGYLAWSEAAALDVFVADGVRHATVDRELRLWSAVEGRGYALVHLEADPGLRADRRTDGDGDAMAIIDAHPVERDAAAALPLAADVVVRPGWDVKVVVAEVLVAASLDRPLHG